MDERKGKAWKSAEMYRSFMFLGHSYRPVERCAVELRVRCWPIRGHRLLFLERSSFHPEIKSTRMRYRGGNQRNGNPVSCLNVKDLDTMPSMHPMSVNWTRNGVTSPSTQTMPLQTHFPFSASGDTGLGTP